MGHYKQQPYKVTHMKPNLLTMVAQVVLDATHSWNKLNQDYSSYGWLAISNKKMLVDTILEYGKSKLLLKDGETIEPKVLHDLWLKKNSELLIEYNRKKKRAHPLDVKYEDLPAYIKMRYKLFQNITDTLMTVGDLLSESEKESIKEQRESKPDTIESVKPLTPSDVMKDNGDGTMTIEMKDEYFGNSSLLKDYVNTLEKNNLVEGNLINIEKTKKVLNSKVDTKAKTTTTKVGRKKV